MLDYTLELGLKRGKATRKWLILYSFTLSKMGRYDTKQEDICHLLHSHCQNVLDP